MEELELEYKERVNKYSLGELIDISNSIDKDTYPLRYKYVIDRIAELQAIPMEQSTPATNKTRITPESQSIDNSILDEIKGIDKSTKNVLNNIFALIFSLLLFAGLGLFSWKPIDLGILVGHKTEKDLKHVETIKYHFSFYWISLFCNN